MESQSRKITVINNRTQSQNVIDSSATTLGELKNELNAAGIPYSGMTFYEGRSRTELKDDASVLPRDVPFRGQIVNDLVFLLSAPQKNIKSGAMSRAEVYAEIKKRNLQEEVQELFGKNFTMCKTQDLIDLLEKKAGTTKKEEKAKPAKQQPEKKEKPVSQDRCNHQGEFKSPFVLLLKILYQEDILSDAQIELLKASLEQGDKVATAEAGNDKLSQAEINELFNFVH